MSGILLSLVYRLMPRGTYRRLAIEVDTCGGPTIDIGGGPGLLGRYLSSYYVDVDPEIALLREASRRPKSDEVLGVGEALPIRGGSAGFVVLMDTLHHTLEPDRVLEESTRVLAPGGCIEILDVDSSSKLSRPLIIIERLLGYPARFMNTSSILDVLTKLYLNVEIVDKGLLSVKVRARKGRPQVLSPQPRP